MIPHQHAPGPGTESAGSARAAGWLILPRPQLKCRGRAAADSHAPGHHPSQHEYATTERNRLGSMHSPEIGWDDPFEIQLLPLCFVAGVLEKCHSRDLLLGKVSLDRPPACIRRPPPTMIAIGGDVPSSSLIFLFKKVSPASAAQAAADSADCCRGARRSRFGRDQLILDLVSASAARRICRSDHHRFSARNPAAPPRRLRPAFGLLTSRCEAHVSRRARSLSSVTKARSSEDRIVDPPGVLCRKALTRRTAIEECRRHRRISPLIIFGAEIRTLVEGQAPNRLRKSMSCRLYASAMACF